jgi:hypothetical protein
MISPRLIVHVVVLTIRTRSNVQSISSFKFVLAVQPQEPQEDLPLACAKLVLAPEEADRASPLAATLLGFPEGERPPANVDVGTTTRRARTPKLSCNLQVASNI